MYFVMILLMAVAKSAQLERVGNTEENKVIEKINSETHVMDIENKFEADYVKTKIPILMEPMGKSMTFESDSTPQVHAEGRAVVIFGDEIRRPTDLPVIFPDEIVEGPDISNRPVSSHCTREGEILYRGRCYQLLSSRPCGEDKWLVMKGHDLAECEPRPCPMGQLFYQDKCVNLDDSTICAKGMMLYIELTGLAFCDCNPDHIYLADNDICIPEYEQGRCPSEKYAYHEKNKICYLKTYIGYCEQDHIMIQGNKAYCKLAGDRNIFEVPTLRRCPKGSKRDLLHRCRRRFNVPSIPSVLKARHLYGGCPAGWIKTPIGHCKRIVNLFAALNKRNTM